MYKKNKKNILVLFIIVLILLIIVKALLNVSKSKYVIKYNNMDFHINESEDNGELYIEIKNDNKKYPVSIISNIKIKKDKNINKIYYYNHDNYECLLPIINSKVEVDMMCYNNNLLYNYHNIKGIDKKLDEFVKSINEYDESKFIDNTKRINQMGTISIYRNNNIDKKVIITTYRGIYNLSQEVKLFNDDVYKNNISTFINHYYIVADYNSLHEFNYFYVVDINTNEVFKIKSKYDISFDSYIQGIVDNEVYIYDVNNETQYKINIDKRKVSIVNLDDEVRYYKNNKWLKISKAKANTKILFDFETLDNDFSEYDYVIKNQYNYYLFKKEKNYYKLFRVNKNDLSIIKYLFKIKTTDIKIVDDYLYFVYGNNLYYYTDNTGLRTLLKDTELKFNDTIKFYIY